MARDPPASVDGFRVLVLLVMEHLFGLLVCAQCPDCNLGSSPYTPCQDERGSSATLMGGVFGRMDKAYVTIEAQKSTGSLHAHCQCFVQCLHQHTALEEIFRLGAKKLEELRTSYLTYSGHVMHGVYEGHSQEEASWPEHKNEQSMIERPMYQRLPAVCADSGDAAEAMSWAMEYLKDDVARLQFLKASLSSDQCGNWRKNAVAWLPKRRQSRSLQKRFSAPSMANRAGHGAMSMPS